MTAATTSIGRLARWMLLCCTLFGLAAMHTGGHTGLNVGLHAGAAHATAADEMVNVAKPALTAVETCADGHCDEHGAGHGWTICVAILQGLATAILLVLLLLTGLPANRGIRTVLDLVAEVPRAPPQRTTGLTITSVTVLRI